MMRTLFIAALLTGGFVAAGPNEAWAAAKQNQRARLEAAAKVPKADAIKIALTKVPTGTITRMRVAKKNQRLIWMIDLKTPRTAPVTKLDIDANTGEIVSLRQQPASSPVKRRAAGKGATN